MRKISADLIFLVSQPPISKGIIILDDNNTIMDILDEQVVDYEIQNVEKYQGFICPGFINTHCHLELSYLKNRISEKIGLHNFILEIHKKRKEDIEIIKEASVIADKEMYDNGIKAVGDISNNNLSFSIKDCSKLVYHTFIEVYGSDPDSAELVFNKAINLFNEFSDINFVSIVPHSPYSVSKKLLYKIKEHACENNSILCMHNQENEDENIFFRGYNGNIGKRLKLYGIEDNSIAPTGLNSLASVAEYLPESNSILLVHNTVSKAQDIEFAVEYFKDLWWCFCANSNSFLENKLPDIRLFLNNENNITIGTDSLASNKSLSILDELKTIQFNLPSVDLKTLIKWGTFNGAAFLKLQNMLGSIEKGKKPGINLIENVDLLNVKLLENSRVRVLV